MDLKVVAVAVCLCAFFVTSTEAGIPKCCISTKKQIPFRVLLKVQRWDMQQSNGFCDIPALVLYVKDKRTPVCADPRVKRTLLGIQRRMKQNRIQATL